MIELFVFLGILAICSLVARIAGMLRFVGRKRRSPNGRLRQDLFIADQRIGSEFQRARRDMNDAAGQSWRNLAG